MARLPRVFRAATATSTSAMAGLPRVFRAATATATSTSAMARLPRVFRAATATATSTSAMAGLPRVFPAATATATSTSAMARLPRVFRAATATSTSTSACRFCFSRNFITQAKTAVTPLQDRVDDKIFCNSDASGDLIRQSGGSVSWVLRDNEGNLIEKGCKWFSGVDFARNTDYLELLGFETLIKSIPKEYIGFLIEIYCDNPGAIYLLEAVKQYYDQGLSYSAIIAQISQNYSRSPNHMNQDMVQVAINICVLMQNFNPSSAILRVARSSNLVADGMARYARGFVTEKEVFLGHSFSTGVVV